MTTFFPSSYRASASDLTIAVSPLGLVELSDEEFEVHGPRINRYANSWAWYLGHHWAYKREIGDSQITVNWCRAFADYHLNFHFGKGVQFFSPEASAAIVPYLLKRVWDEDNDRMSVIYELGQNGVVTGDVFAKVAYEPPWRDPNSFVHSGRIRILPLNPAYCFPTWHPHDRARMLEFKLKYKFWTTAADGTKAVATYVEIITDEWIREYVNDEMISARPNPLGRIPIAYTQHRPISSSPWGLGEVQELVPLNREYNEKVTDVSEIINYHAAPVTVITGAKPSNLEKGPRKVWTIGNKDAKIQNLTLDTNFQGPLGYLQLIKLAMHELSGVPESALGTMQPLTNTSGVALHLQYLPLMLVHQRVRIQYSRLFRAINELVILYAAVYEPTWLMYNPEVAAIELKPGQYPLLNPNDPLTYRTTVEWPDPLPLDVLMALQEEQAKMAMGIQSKVGVLRRLGEHFPEQKLQEVQEELLEDMQDQAALDLLRAQAAQITMQATGVAPDGTPLVIPGASEKDAEGNVTGYAPTINTELANEILARAYGDPPAQRMDFNQGVGAQA